MNDFRQTLFPPPVPTTLTAVFIRTALPPSLPSAAPAADTSGADALDRLTAISFDDLLDSVGQAWLRHTPLALSFWWAARNFAQVVHDFDRRVGQTDLATASRSLLGRMSGGWQVRGGTHVPADGPLFILANHPGMTDTVALFAALAARPDLKVIALDRPFLRALPHAARHLIFLPESEGGRLGAVRAAVRHLEGGGALLTFPAGAIEPDPGATGRAEAIASLEEWSDSFAAIARRVPATRLQVAIVSDAVSAEALHHPLVRLRPDRQSREKLAASLQIVFPAFRQRPVRVSFGPTIGVEQHSSAALVEAVRGAARDLIHAREHPT